MSLDQKLENAGQKSNNSTNIIANHLGIITDDNFVYVVTDLLILLGVTHNLKSYIQ